MELKNLIEVHLDLPRLSQVLDDLGTPGRLWSVNQWTHANLAVLWEAAKGFRPLTLDDLVPPSVGPLVPVVHVGKNSLPVFAHFRKQFCKPKDESSKELFGYNVQSTSVFTGPGYFVARVSSGEGASEGEIDFDYTKSPTEKPEGWPPIVPASARLGRFVYGGAIDVVRGISSHVSIGRVRKNGRDEDAWFALVREDPEPPS
jgi:hypothetical protein